jgi:hypothetical protein
MRQLLGELASPAYAHQTALVGLVLLAPAAVATFDLAEAVGPMLALWAVVALMAIIVRRKELILAAGLGAALTVLALVLKPEQQRALVAAFLLLIAASVGLWARAAAASGSASFSVGRLLLTSLLLFGLAAAAFVLLHRETGPPRRYLAAAVQPIHFVLYWEVIVLYGTLLFPASAMPWVMALLVGALINYSLIHLCAFTMGKHWLLTNEALWDVKGTFFRLTNGQVRTLTIKVAILFTIAMVRYVRYRRCKPSP